MFSDFHAHLDGYAPDKLKEVLENAKSAHVEIIIAIGSTLETSEETVSIAQQHPGVLAAVGIHPWNAVTPTDEMMKRLRRLAAERNVVALGETGLDYARTPGTKQAQAELFREHVLLARELGLLLNMHCRQADRDMLEILRRVGHPKPKGALHGFEGKTADLTQWLDMGFCISIGLRAFTRGDQASFREAVRSIPMDRLLVETDSSPRSLSSGDTLGPTSAVLVAEKLAAILGAPAEEIGNTTTANLKRLLADAR